MKIVFSVFVGGCLSLLAVGARAQTSSPRAAARSVPSSVTNTAEAGENVYDAAKVHNWREAAARLALLKTATAGIRTQVRGAQADKQKLQSAVAALERAVSQQDASAAMGQANQITLVAADLSEPFHPRVPADVARLDYYGRQLELQDLNGQIVALPRTVAALQLTWQRVRPEVEAHGGVQVAREFEVIVARLSAAKNLSAYRRATQAELDEVDRLEGVFAH
jgi:hypothetical protein